MKSNNHTYFSRNLYKWFRCKKNSDQNGFIYFSQIHIVTFCSLIESIIEESGIERGEQKRDFAQKMAKNVVHHAGRGDAGIPMVRYEHG